MSHGMHREPPNSAADGKVGQMLIGVDLGREGACTATGCERSAGSVIGMRGPYCEKHLQEAIRAADIERKNDERLRALGDAELETQNNDILTIAAGVNPKDVMGRQKPGLGNVPPGPLYAVARAFDDGAGKYGAFNWRGLPVKASVYHDACKRHLDQWFHGNDRAADSGVHHLAHAVACLLIVLDAEQQKSLKDDRPQRNIPLDEIIAAMSAPQGVKL